MPKPVLIANKHEIGSTPSGAGEGWSGVVHGQQLGASMPGHLLLIAWPYNGQIITSFRYG